MPNLMETVQTQKALTVAASQRSIKVCKTKNDLCLSASAKKVKGSERFYLVKVPVRKIPMLSVEASEDNGAIVIDTNSHRRRATVTGFVPKIIVLKGIRTLQAAKADEKMFCNAWVGERALRRMHISAEDSIGANALQSKLQRLISDHYKNQKSSKATDSGTYSPSPWIEEVYPFDGCFVFRYDGEMYKQTYILDKKTSEPALTGEPIKAVVKYVAQVTASSLADIIYGDSYVDKTMSQEMMFDKRNNSSPALGAIAYNPPIVPDGTYYPAGSELARPELRTMLNVREALNIYLNILKDGMKGPLPSLFSPVMVPTDKFLMNACNEAEVAAKLARRKIDVLAFVNWQHDTLTKKGTPTKYGLAASGYAYVGDPKDISTWHLRANSVKEIKKSLGLVMHCEGVPDSRKNAIRGKLKALYKKASVK